MDNVRKEEQHYRERIICWVRDRPWESLWQGEERGKEDGRRYGKRSNGEAITR